MSRDDITYLLKDFGSLLKKYGYNGNAFVNPFRYSDPLICKDLDLIFEIANKFNFKVRITTNGVSFNESNALLLNQYINTLEDNVIRISVIGSTAEKIKKNMNVNLDMTLKRLANVKLNYPKLASKIKVGLAEVTADDEEEKEFKELEKKFTEIGISTYRKKKWINNRIDGDDYKQNEYNFITSCNLWKNKLLRRLEIMYDGSVVLCDDDAEGRKRFGNVFEKGIEYVWNNQLLEEHKLIYQKNFSENKNKLICKSCTRANWGSRRSGPLASFQEIGLTNSFKNLLKNNVNWI